MITSVPCSASFKAVLRPKPRLPPVISVMGVEVFADAYEHACLAGLGTIQVPAPGVRGHLLSGSLIAILPQYRPEPMPVSSVYAHRQNLPRRVQVFMDWIAELMTPHLAAPAARAPYRPR